MTFELVTLVWAVGVLLILLMFQGALVPIVHGLGWGLGSRDAPRDLSVMQGRAARTVANHMESLAMFAPIVIVANLSGVSSSLTVWGAGLFAVARLAFAIFYLAGVPYLRSAAWGLSIIGLLMIAAEVIQKAL